MVGDAGEVTQMQNGGLREDSMKHISSVHADSMKVLRRSHED